MTLVRIAQIAGVSASTVSRVINNHPRVSEDTAAAVRRAIEQTQFRPRRAGRRGLSDRTRTGAVAFFVFGATGAHAEPAFEPLLRGVSAALTDQGQDLVFAFVSDPNQLPSALLDRRIDGLLLHGEQPSAAVQARLQNLPAVWLMANRERPAWGDQVMPDSTVIGEIAARYLIRRGHRRLAFLSLLWGPWLLSVRAMSFERIATDLGAQVHTLHAPPDDSRLWQPRDLPRQAEMLVDRLLALGDARPTGLFIPEDRQVVAVDAALRQRGLPVGPPPTGEIEIISCNNERPHLMSLSPVPATIDIRTESIGRRGVELLLARLRDQRPTERIRTMVEPVLVEPAAV